MSHHVSQINTTVQILYSSPNSRYYTMLRVCELTLNIRAEETSLFLVMSPKQERAEYIAAVSSEMLILLTQTVFCLSFCALY